MERLREIHDKHSFNLDYSLFYNEVPKSHITPIF